jgi:DNA-binding SARP family transcriptional activator
MGTLSLRLLGGYEVQTGLGQSLAVPTRKAQGLLAYLALTPGQTHPRDKLATLLWAEASALSARNALRQTLFVLRKALGSVEDGMLVVTGNAVSLPAGNVETDVAAFERAVAAGTPAALEEAAGLYRGDLLAGLGVAEPVFEEWLMSERERLRELALETLARLLVHQRAAGDATSAVQSAFRLLALDPLQEAVHRALMRLYVQLGRRDAALRQYQECVELLHRELGVEPDPETKTLYRDILHLRPAPSRAGPPTMVSPPPAAPLIGRVRELSALDAALGQAWSGAGGVVAILGEAGIGKSRLLAELAADARRRGGFVWLGRAHESEQALPLGPWVSALRQDDVFADPGSLEGLGRPWLAELGRLFPELWEAGGPPALPEPSDHLRLFEAVGRLVRHLALRQPSVIALEDLHWVDDMSARLLAFLGRRLHGAPVLIVLTAREEELGSGPALERVLDELDETRQLTRLTVPPLGREETAVLIRGLSRAGVRAEELARLGEQVWEASRGNPFVAVETIRALQEGAPASSTTLPLPDRVRSMIAHRLDRLSEGGQRLVGTAAVIGGPFALPLLACAADVTERGAAEGVEELVRRRVFRSVGEEFEFTHERVRQVAYERLLPPHRTVLHGLVARALETIYGDRQDAHYAALGPHYREARVWDKAVESLTRFAETAAHRYAHAEALAALEEADGYVERLPAEERDRVHLDLVLRRCDILYFFARLAETVDLLLRERARLDRLDAADLAGPYYFQLARAYSLLGRRAAAAETARLGVEAATRSGDDVTRAKAHYVLAREKYWLGDPGQGLEHGLEATRLLDGRGEPYWLAMASMWTAQNHSLMGEFAAALAAMARARELADALGDSRLQSDFAWRTAQMEATRGEWETAIELCERALENPSTHPLNRANALARLGFAHVEAGHPVAAIPLLQQAIEHVTPIAPTGQARGWFLTVLGEAHLLAGDLARAGECAAEALEILETAGYRDGIARARRALGRIAQARGAHDLATRLLTEALDIYTSESARFEVGRTRLALAEVAHARGDREKASRHLQEASGLFAALGVWRYTTRVEAVVRSGDFRSDL